MQDAVQVITAAANSGQGQSQAPALAASWCGRLLDQLEAPTIDNNAALPSRQLNYLHLLAKIWHLRLKRSKQKRKPLKEHVLACCSGCNRLLSQQSCNENFVVSIRQSTDL